MMSRSTGNFTTGDGRSVSIKDISDLYRDGVSLSAPSSGRIQHLGKENYSVTCNFTAVDCDTLGLAQTTKFYSLVTSNTSERHISSVNCITQPLSIKELVSITSNNGRFVAKLQQDMKGDEKRQLLSIWDRSRLLKTININEVEEHGLIIVDSQFSSMVWCPYGEQDKLLYVCDRKKIKFESFFKQQVEGNTKQNSGDDQLKVEDWGETLNGIEHTVAAVLDLTNFKIATIDFEGYSLANSVWLRGEDEIASVALHEGPRKIGLVYCNSRPSKLVVHKVSGELLFEIAEENYSLHDLRVDNSGKKIMYLKNPSFGAHFHSVSMHLYDVDSAQDQELASGLFIQKLPSYCFSEDNQFALFINFEHLHSTMCLIEVASKQITKIEFPTSGVEVLDFRYDIILAAGSDINTTPTLYVATFTSPRLVAWHQIEDCIHLDEITYQEYKFETSDKASSISALLVSPYLGKLYENLKLDYIPMEKHESELPTIVVPHGGPHSLFWVRYMSRYVFYARLGLKTLLINYRGSLGVDESYVKSLCGNVGSMDVDDCLQALRQLTKSKTIDPTRLIFASGSHGGFIGCHLSCQDEFNFSCAILRNPVVDLSSTFATTDIPDWALAEGLGHEKFDPSWMIEKNDLCRLFELSPISLVRKANVPTLMLLGSADRRVKMFQGERWVDMLRARGIETKCKIYNDDHALSKPEVDVDSTITTVIWILQHLRSDS